MSDFTTDEMQTLRVAMRLYMESMRTSAITFKDDPDTSAYFANEAMVAEELWNKMVRMDLESMRAVRKALADALMDEARAEVSGYYVDARSEELRPVQEDTRQDRLRTVKRQYTDRPMHGPF